MTKPVVLLLGLGFVAAAQPLEVVPPGTTIIVRTNEPIDMHRASDGRIFSAVLDQSIIDRDGRVVIPRGANAELIVRNLGHEDMAVDLESIYYEGRRYVVSASNENYRGTEKPGIGENKRTGKFLGGGALLGTIIGAVAGGGKGAALGALAGGAAGAGAEVATRWRDIRVPAETLLTFRLERPLELGRGQYSRDNGYDRNGHHYHNDYNPYPNDYNAPPPPPEQR